MSGSVGQPGRHTERADVQRVARGLRAARGFLNTMPLTDGASRQAIDREYVGVKLIPDALMALDSIDAALRAAEEAQDEYKRKWENAEEYAKEGWTWLADALDAMGVETVFDIKGYAERRAALAAASTEGAQGPHPRDCSCRDPGFLNHDCPIHGRAASTEGADE